MIRAEIIGDRCEAEGLSARAASPVVALCTQLLAAGVDPATPLEAYRGSTLALRVKSIGQAAALEVYGSYIGPRRARPMRERPEAAE